MSILMDIKELQRGRGGVTSQPGLSRASTPDFGGFKFQSLLVPKWKRVTVLESRWCEELHLALFILSWVSKD